MLATAFQQNGFVSQPLLYLVFLEYVWRQRGETGQQRSARDVGGKDSERDATAMGVFVWNICGAGRGSSRICAASTRCCRCRSPAAAVRAAVRLCKAGAVVTVEGDANEERGGGQLWAADDGGNHRSR